MDFEDFVGRMRGLCSRHVTARLLDAEGAELARWEGELVEAALDSSAVADRLEERVAGNTDAEAHVEALRSGTVALFELGGRPVVLDPSDFAGAEAEGDRLRFLVRDGTAMELTAE